MIKLLKLPPIMLVPSHCFRPNICASTAVEIGVVAGIAFGRAACGLVSER